MYRLNPPYHGYQITNEKRIYPIDRNLVEDQLEDFYTIFNDEDEDVIYSDKTFKEVVVNFVGIESSCNNCYAIFPSKSKLHNHLETGCWEIAFPFILLKAISSISIIASKTIYQSFGFKLIFKD